MEIEEFLQKQHGIALDAQQQEAVRRVEGPVLLLASPGGGKTTVLVARIAHMVVSLGVDPGRILTITYNKESSLDMKRRFVQLFGGTIDPPPKFSTIHSLCYAVLLSYVRLHGVRPPLLLESSETVSKNRVLGDIYRAVHAEFAGEDTLETLSTELSYVKNMMLTGEELEAYQSSVGGFLEILRRYEAFKRENGYIDFDDMLTDALDVLQKNPRVLAHYRGRYDYLLVDEAQDTSKIQHAIIRLLAAPRNNLFMVGDEDQSIYGFRGAYPEAVLQFGSWYPGAAVLKMEQNYRSTKEIVRCAGRFIRFNTKRYDKRMVTGNPAGEPVSCVTLSDLSRQYAHLVGALRTLPPGKTAAVLYRNNTSAVPVADALSGAGIDFYIKEHRVSFFRHFVVTDMLCFFSLSYDLSDLRSFEKIYYKLGAYLTRNMFEYVKRHITPGEGVFDVLARYEGNEIVRYATLKELQKKILRLKNLPPLLALESIEEELHYNEHLEQRCLKGFKRENLAQRMNMLKSLAAGAPDVDSFLNKLQNVQQIMADAQKKRGSCAVTLSTMHSAKGLEFDRVYLIDLIEGNFPDEASIDSQIDGNCDAMEEEARLFYVAATRARQTLEIITAEKMNGVPFKTSRFVRRLLDERYRPEQDLPAVSPGKPSAKDDGKKDSPHFDKELRTRYGGQEGTGHGLFFNEGDRVYHRSFGKGTVRLVDAGRDRLEIAFDKAPAKQFSLSHMRDNPFLSKLAAGRGRTDFFE